MASSPPDLDQQQADAVLGMLVGGVICYHCRAVCSPRLNGKMFWCEKCYACWMLVTMKDPAMLERDLVNGKGTVDFNIKLTLE